MGFFDKFKKKIVETVEKTSEAVGFNRLKESLEKTRKTFSDRLSKLLKGRKIDQALLDEVEDILITSDIGVATSEKLIGILKERVKKENFENAEDLYKILKEEILNLIIKSDSAEADKNYTIDDSKKPHSIMVIGVNGAGKTTTIGKLAFNYKNAGRKVVIGAADTFRAAANEQLEVWSQRAGVDIVQKAQGSDPSSVAYETMASAIKNESDVVIIDTAGRLHNKVNLMNELEKMGRVMKKHRDDAPNEVYLVLDGTTGQNALQQAKEFSKVANITGIVLTKLDGTAKGGIVIAIADELKIPVRYIGVGEKITDLQPFDAVNYVEALFGSDSGEETFIEE
ncbi:MAG: signal recognition particle-docking protein FtsY [Ignavibacteriae bacterium HGW-Ignavibacteriae-4]|jgi:fused signal recognition particle receptor|nr:MAG: signal recognition particle-docking protein FtsY [Ignavibacteriae bacterium HGW-Ignavibacteriae-4]